ncbi:MAG: DUF6774 domain-containing protein [Eubacterium sp.]
MDPCALNVTVSGLACAISQGKSDEEIALLSAFFVQLGDSMATILAAKACNDSKNNSS